VDSEFKSPGRTPAPPEAPGEIDVTGRVLGTVLRAGVLISAAIILLGVVLFVHRRGIGAILFAPPGLPPGGADDPSTLGELRAALNSNAHVAAAVTDIGLLTLIVTPVISVVVALVSFAKARDRTYVLLAAAVLCTLALGARLERL